MDAKTIEEGLKTEIEALGIPVVFSPEKPAGYFPQHDPGEVLVRYIGHKNSDRDVSGVAKTKTVSLELVIVSRQIREPDGIYAWSDQIARRLDGYTLPGVGGHLEITEEGFSDYNDGTWFFTQQLTLTLSTQNEQQDDYFFAPLIGAQNTRREHSG